MESKNNPEAFRKGLWLVLLASLCMSTAPTVIKIGLNIKMKPIPLLTSRMWVATFALWLFFSLFSRRLLVIDRQAIIWCFWAALTNAISMSCFYVALGYIDASIAIVIFSISPAITLLLLALGGERLTFLHILRLFLAIVGIYLLVGPGGNVQISGVLLVLATAAFFALHVALIQWKLRKVPAQTVTLYITTMMAVMLTGLYLLTCQPGPSNSWLGWGVILWTALISTAIARFAMFAGIQRIGSGQTALLGPIQTLLTIFWAVLFLGERLSLIQWIGGSLVIFSALLLKWVKKPTAFQPKPQTP